MRVHCKPGSLYRLAYPERLCKKSEFCPWDLQGGKWCPQRGFIDVKPFQDGLLCVANVPQKGEKSGMGVGIFMVGEQFVAIGLDYVEEIQ